jgi:2,3-bisphosphoglycerate-dependent phosphoglycerate mutase
MTAHYCYWEFEKLPQDRKINQFVIDYRLNERHYGSLQGYSKEKIESGFYGHGSSTVQLWRRSWHAVPPLLSHNDPRRKKELVQFINICGGDEQNVPRGESLDQVAKNRIQPFIQEVLTPTLNRSSRVGGGTGLIVAHANSLRALIGIFAKVEDDPIALKKLERMKIPTGAPLVLRYQSFPDGSTRVCGLDGIPCEQRDESSPEDQQPDLPVWPLGCIPI